jgi:hypothetical protein
MHLLLQRAVPVVLLLLLHHQCLPSGLLPCDLKEITEDTVGTEEQLMLTASATDAAMMQKCKARCLIQAGHLLAWRTCLTYKTV